MVDSRGRLWSWVGMLLAGVLITAVVLGGLSLSLTFIYAKAPQPEVILPFLLVVGVIVLLGILAGMAFVFTKIGYPASQERALGLPEGSVSAVIALMLVLIFAITSTYLYGNLARYEMDATASTGVTADQLAKFPSQNIVSVNPDPADATKYTVQLANTHEASNDFAKQVMQVVGTLLVAVVGFYFGQRSTAVAAAAMVAGKGRDSRHSEEQSTTLQMEERAEGDRADRSPEVTSPPIKAPGGRRPRLRRSR